MDKTGSLEALEKICQSPQFVDAPRIQRFLRYLVDHVCRDSTDRLKGYTIGLDVFDRAEDFDPSDDSIVRVEAARLRTKLTEYYAGPGKNEKLRFVLPKGGYNLRIEPRQKICKTKRDPGQSKLTDNSIAVLPFVLLSSDEEQSYLADGMTDAVINRLGRSPALRITSFTSTIRYKGHSESLTDIADELAVKYIFEGTYLPVGDRVRVTAQLIDGENDIHLWADSFERDIADILAVQTEISEAIARSIGIVLNKSVSPQLRRIDPAAYEANLQGRRYRMQLTEDGLTQAIKCFEKAIAIEPNYGEAYAGIAGCYCSFGTYGIELRAPHEVIPHGIDLAEKAISLDGSYVEGRAFLGIMKLKYLWDWEGAASEFKAALALNPCDTRALLQYSLYFESLGEFAEALRYANKAYAVDPFNKGVMLNRAWQLFQSDDLEQGLRQMTQLTESEPKFWGGHWGRGHVLRELLRFDEAHSAFEQAVEMPGGNTLPLEGLGHCAAVMGNHELALNVIKDLQRQAQDKYVPPYRGAVIYAGLEDESRMFEELDKAMQLRCRSLAWIGVAKEFKAYRQNSRFVSVLNEIGIPQTSGLK